MNFKNKKLQAGIAVTLAVAIVLGSTFAWFNYNQQALNIFAGSKTQPKQNPSVNLRDDFDDEGLGKDTGMTITANTEDTDEYGNIDRTEKMDENGIKEDEDGFDSTTASPYKHNKDVYVENSGDQPLYVRVRLDEFMSIGGYSIIQGVNALYPNTWSTHTCTGDSPENCGNIFHNYFDWVLGGKNNDNDPDKGAKLYLPAPASKRAQFPDDGSPIEPGVISYYDTALYYENGGNSIDYNNELYVEPTGNGINTTKRQGEKLYGTTSSDIEKQTLAEAHARIEGILSGTTTEKLNGVDVEGATVRDQLKNAYDMLDESEITESDLNDWLEKLVLGYYDGEHGDIFVPIQRTMQTETIYTMQQWLAAGSPTGNYWIIDTDGWCYWASSLQPGVATGLLLSEVNYKNQNLPYNTWDYKINVKLEAVTADEIYRFGVKGMNIVNAIAKNYVYDKLGDTTYTFLNNGDNTFTLMNADGTVGDKYVVYTGDISEVSGGALYNSSAYGVSSTFLKNIPGGASNTEFTVVTPGIVTGMDGKRYIKLSYGSGKTAWLGVGSDREFKALVQDGSSLRSNHNMLIWTTDGTTPGSGNESYSEPASNVTYNVGEVIEADSFHYVVLKIEDGNTVLISRDVLTSSTSQSNMSSYLSLFSAGSVTKTLLNHVDKIEARLLLESELALFTGSAISYKIGNYYNTADPVTWWLQDANKYVDISGNVQSSGNAGLRPVLIVDSVKLQNFLAATNQP